jgi:arabinose-5-phosphate isomerase
MRRSGVLVAISALPGRALLEEAKRCLGVTIDALAAARDRADENLIRAIGLVVSSRKKVVFVGIGKSGHIARKLAATFSSTGTPSIYLSASEALHGDLGVLEGGECVFFLSKSGTTAELLALVPAVRARDGRPIGLIGDVRSPLAAQMDVTIDASVACESDALRLAPMASTSVALALGDAIASALMVARGFRADDFFQLHPGGQLGRSSSLRAAQVMRKTGEIAAVAPDDRFPAILHAISERRLGATCVVAPGGQLVGLVTDGDLRRYLEHHGTVENASATEIMNVAPATVGPETPLREVLELMNEPGRPRHFIPVVDEEHRLAGGIWYHDVVR